MHMTTSSMGSSDILSPYFLYLSVNYVTTVSTSDRNVGVKTNLSLNFDKFEVSIYTFAWPDTCPWVPKGVVLASHNAPVSPPYNTPQVIRPPHTIAKKSVVALSRVMCIWTQTVIYIYVFVGATTGHNHFWWISTLALGSSKFSSGWLMGLLTDVCTNLLLLPPLPAFVPLPQVCVSERVSCCALAGCGCSFQLLLMDFPLFSWTTEAKREGWVGQCSLVRAQTI